MEVSGSLNGHAHAQESGVSASWLVVTWYMRSNIRYLVA